jgi:hypothetical protein
MIIFSNAEAPSGIDRELTQVSVLAVVVMVVRGVRVRVGVPR